MKWKVFFHVALYFRGKGFPEQIQRKEECRSLFCSCGMDTGLFRSVARIQYRQRRFYPVGCHPAGNHRRQPAHTVRLDPPDGRPLVSRAVRFLVAPRRCAQQFGVLRSDGTAERALFIIDKAGIIRFILASDINRRPNLKEIVDALKAIHLTGNG